MDASPSAAVVRLAGDLGVRTCEATHAALLNAIVAHDAVVVDCTDAEETDASFVQLLLAARKTAAGRGCRFSLSAMAGDRLLGVLVRGGFLDPRDPDPFWSEGSGAGR
jgi:anti-anti-sigma regulatory factor